MSLKNANIDLHVHPFLGKNTLVDVISSMKKTNLDVVAVESLDDSLFFRVKEETKRYFSSSMIDESGVKINDSYVLNAREYNTLEGIHILTVGYSYDEADKNTSIIKIIEKGLENNALVVLDHPFVDNEVTRTAGHISEKKEIFIEDLSRYYAGNIALEWNGYCVPWMRKGLQLSLNAINDYKILNKCIKLINSFGQKIKSSFIEDFSGALLEISENRIEYYDVNKKVLELSSSLSDEGYTVPVVADTDLHARGLNDLKHMGKARIIMDLKGDSPREIVDSMIENIFSNNYANKKNYVSFFHHLKNFSLPVLFPNRYHKPRA